MAERQRPILLIAQDDWIVGTIQAILSSPALLQGLTESVAAYHARSSEEAIRTFSQVEFFLILLEYGVESAADSIDELKRRFVKAPIILIARYEQEAEVLALIGSTWAQDYLLEEELTESILRRLLRPAHLFVETRRRLEEMQVLNQVAQVSNQATEVAGLLGEVTEIIAHSLYPDHFGFVLRDANGRWRPHPAYHSRHPLQLPDVLDDLPGILAWVRRNGRPRLIADVRQEPDYLGLDPNTVAELCVPLIIQGETIGLMNAESMYLNAFNEADEQLMMTLARQLATAIEKIQLLEAERQERQAAETLRDIMATLASTLDHNQVLDEILAQLDKVVPHDTATVALLQGDHLLIQAARGFANPVQVLDYHLPASDTFFQEVQRTRRPIYVPDVRQHPDFMYWGDSAHVRGWICAPLIVRDQVLGVLTVDNRMPDAYSPRDIALAQAFANQAAVAIENAYLYEAEQKGRQTAEILRAATSALTRSLEQDVVLETLIRYLVQLIPVDSASVMMLDESGEYAQLRFGWGFEQWTEETAVAAIRVRVHDNRTLTPVFRDGQHILVEDTATEPHWEHFPETSYVRNWLGVPIFLGEKVIGAFSLDKATPRFFTEEHVRLVQTITAQAAVSLQNAHLFAETERRAVELETLTQLSADLRLADSLDEILAILLRYATAVAGANFSSIYLLDSESDALTLYLTHPPEPAMIGHRHRLGHGITGHVARSGEIYICHDVQQSPYYEPIPIDHPLLNSLRATISLPLKTKNRVIGVMHHSVEQSHEFSRAEINLLTAVSEIGASALERAMLLETLEQRVAQRTRELAEAYEQLQELDRLKTKFVSDVSHELRTPITNLSLYVDLLAQGRPERQAQYQSILRHQVDRLNKLIEDTLHISRLDMGRVQMRLAPLNLNDLVQTCVAELTLLAERSGRVRLTAVLQPHLPSILGDRGQLHIVVQNLLKNAIDYTSEGRIEVTTSTEQDGFVCLKVADTGMGIADADLPHLFERFYRGTAVAQSALPGTGLGLAIVKEIVEQHQGRIDVSSQPGEGTTFTVYLPLGERLTVNSEQ